MPIETKHLPYFYEDNSQWIPLPNGIEERTNWEYSVIPYHPHDMDGVIHPLIIERLRRERSYRLDAYIITANTVDEWHYLQDDDKPYAGFTQGYRGYWDGFIECDGERILPPEVAVMLGFTPDLCGVPPFIETISADDLLDLLHEARTIDSDTAPLSAHRSLPVGTPGDTPTHVVANIHQLRAKVGLRSTRGHSAVIEWMMAQTGIQAASGGWTLTPSELERRQRMTV